MIKPSPPKTVNFQRIFQLFLILFCLEYLALLIYLFSSASEPSVATLAGFSTRRLLLITGTLFLLGGAIAIFWDSLKSNRIFRFVGPKLTILFRNNFIYSIVQSFLFLALLACLIYEFFTYFPTASENIFDRLVPFLFYFTDHLASVMGQYAGIFIFWIFLVVLKLFIFLSLFERVQQNHESRSALVRWTAATWVVTIFLFMLYFFRGTIKIQLSYPRVLSSPMEKALLLALWLSAWSILRKYVKWADRFFILFACISIWLATFLVYKQMAQWMNTTGTPKSNYFNYLAEAFLHGRLYLINPPAKWDLTSYQGKWFVPFPPSPAFLLLPFIAIWGIHAINTTTFSITIAACTSVIIFLIFHQQLRLRWIQLSYGGITWLVALFSFGTVYWWLSGLSQNAFFSQVCTVFFCSLSFWFALKKFPAWLVGLALAGGVMARPDVFLLWPALAAFTIQMNQDNGKIDWKRIIRWGIASGIPVALGAAFLLCYNFLRFGSFLDFGYNTINGWDLLLKRANEYGIFSPHFIPGNLYLIFIGFSFHLIAKCSYYIIRGDGMNIFFTTPGIIYLFRKIKVNWWIGGCWCSIALLIALLSMYYNGGAIQYGYRYMMDFIIPIMMIIAYNAGKKISVPLRILILMSILINYYGIISWQRSPC